MLSCQKLDVYRCAIAFLALAFEISAQATRGNAPLMDQLKRAATSIPSTLPRLRGDPAMPTPREPTPSHAVRQCQCAAILDAGNTLKIVELDRHRRGMELVERIVAMLTRLCR